MRFTVAMICTLANNALFSFGQKIFVPASWVHRDNAGDLLERHFLVFRVAVTYISDRFPFIEDQIDVFADD